MNRLTGSRFWNQSGLDRGEYQENLTYDLNGNIASLYRTGMQMQGYTAPEIMDDLQYYYENNNSNKLSYLKEKGTGNAQSGYPLGQGQTGQTINYDANGNMNKQLDKGISAIAYNYLNLPRVITQSSGNTSYSYGADGIKIKKVLGTKTTDYLNGFQYENSVLEFMQTAEGYYDFENNRYVYNYLDHLGNVRVSYYKNGNVAKILEENNYYPFGLRHIGYNEMTGNSAYNYRYQGQELQETGFYAFKWRNYMPDVGRFFNVDPLAESFPYNSTYAFSENRVIDGIELEGLEVVLLNDTKHNQPIIKAANSGLYKDNPATKTLHVFAHGNPSAMYNEKVTAAQKKAGVGTVDTGAELNSVLNQGSDLWKNSESKDGFTVVLHSCRTGRYTIDKEGNVIDPVASIMSESKEMKGVTIVAPDERDGVSANGKEIGPQVTKNTDHNGDYLPGTPRSEQGKQTSQFGSWNSFQNGQRTDKQPGNTKPEGKDQRSLWDRIFN